MALRFGAYEELTEEVLARGYSMFRTHLESMGITDNVRVKVHRTTAYKGEALAQYRSRSQFRSGPIVWMSPEIADLAALYDVPVDLLVRDTLLHEYGHVIWEFALLRGSPNLKLAVGIDGDEERWAEGWAMGRVKNAREVARLYAAELNG